jgi:hypothetical protein
MHLVGHRLQQDAQEVGGNARGGAIRQLGEGELRHAADGHEEVELALLGPDLGDVDLEKADGVGLEALASRLVAIGLGQARDAVALEAAKQSRARQVRDGGLQGVAAVVQRRQRVAAEGDDDRLLPSRELGGARRSRPSAPIGDISSRAPLRDGLRVHAMAAGQGPQARFTTLDRATGGQRRAGAALQNLAHRASLHAREKAAPSKPGTKHVVSCR